MFKISKILAVVTMVVALAVPAFAYSEWDNGGGDGLWSSAAN